MSFELQQKAVRKQSLFYTEKSRPIPKEVVFKIIHKDEPGYGNQSIYDAPKGNRFFYVNNKLYYR